MSEKLRIGIVLSSTREGRLNDRVAMFVKNAIIKDHEAVVIDPKEIEFSHDNQIRSFCNNLSNAPRHIQDLDETLKALDAYVIVSAEYNWCIPTGVTNIFNNIPQSSVCWKPCGFVNYSHSNVGGAKCANNLRIFSGALGMLPVPKQMLVPRALDIIEEDGTIKDEKVSDELLLVLKDVYWAASALKCHKETYAAPKNAINFIRRISDPRDVEFSQTNQLLNFMSKPSIVPEYLKEIDKTIQSLDALVFVSTEYNWCMPPGLTNMMNNIPQASCCWKPCCFVTYSQDQFGGVRCANELRIFTGGFGMIPVPKQMVIPYVHESINEDGRIKDEKLASELSVVLNDLYYAVRAFKNYKEKFPAPIWHPSA